MNTTQRKWVLSKAFKFIGTHINDEDLDEKKFEAMHAEISQICKDAKYNRECVELFNSLYACFDSKEQEKKNG